MNFTVVSFIFIISIFNVTADYFEDTITFTAFTEDGNSSITTFDDNLSELGCDSNEKIALVVHGWLESIETEWVSKLIRNLQQYRGGCIIFMDYSNHSIVNDYFNLVRKFNPITNVLLKKLHQLDGQGFSADKMFLYGFSFGAQLVIHSGILFGENRIAEIDVCDPAGPGFTLAVELIPTLAAKNVQCIHTSRDKGTNKRNCHQDWMMGRCGRVQEAAGPPPHGSHGLCPSFYNSAFTHDFYATENIYRCPSRRMAFNLPEGFKMGYTERRKNKVFGDLFSPTSECYPYNNYKSLMSVENTVIVGRMARQRRRRQRVSRQRGPSCPE